MGLGDFLGGIGEGVVDIAENVGGAATNVAKATGWVADPHHWDDIGRGVAKAGQIGLEHVDEMRKGVGWLASHPSYWDDAAKQMIVDQFTDPVNIATNVAMLGLTVATGGAAAPAWMAKLGLGAKVGIETAEGLATAAKVTDTVSDVARGARTVEKVAEGAETAQKASRLQRFSEGVDTVLGAPEKAKRAFHSSWTGQAEKLTGGLVRQSDVGVVAAARGRLAERVVGNVEDAGAVRQMAYRAIEGSATKPTTGGLLTQANWRAGKLAGQIKTVRNAEGSFRAGGEITKAIANPEEAAQHFARAGYEYAKPRAQHWAIEHPGTVAKAAGKVLGIGGDEDGKKKSTMPAIEQPRQDVVGRLQGPTSSGGGFPRAATSRSKGYASNSQPMGSVTTVGASTMPTQVGPSDWYGPQHAYSSGRGFGEAPMEQDTGQYNGAVQGAMA